MKHGKKYIDAAKLIENNKTYDPTEALELCCKTATAKFDETVELHVRLGVDSRHADQQVRGAVVLPNGTGKNVRVIAIAKGDAAKAAEVEYRLDKQNIIHVPIGKASFGAEKLMTNLDTVLDAIAKAKPAAAKGQYFKSATIATTMGPGVRVATNKYGV